MTTALQANNSLAVFRDDNKFIILLIPRKLKSSEGSENEVRILYTLEKGFIL